MKNIFLTGEINVGKSTIINKVCSELGIEPQGFNTIAIKIEDEGLEGNDSEILDTDKKFSGGKYTNNDNFFILPYGVKQPSPEDRPFACRNIKERRRTSFHEVFDNAGVKILQESRTNERCNLIIMDELGFFENEAYAFQDEVKKCLDVDIAVFGVIKPKNSDFLNMVRSHPQTKLFEITEENRNERYTEVYQTIKNLLKI